MAKHDIEYQNNPFYIGLNGLQLLFKRAQPVGIYAAILAGIGFVINTMANIIDAVDEISKPDYTPGLHAVETSYSTVDMGIFISVIAFVVVICVVTTFVSALLYGVLEYTSAKLAQNKNVALGEAFTASLKNLPGYVWVYIVMIVKVFLWTLLLIVPGIIMAVRYSLAGTVYFAENKRGNAAVKRSAELTKGAWFTTFAGTGLWNIMTLGVITPIVSPSANAILYRQFKSAADSGSAKPSAHWLSWLTFFAPIILIVSLFGITIFILFTTLILWLAAQ